MFSTFLNTIRFFKRFALIVLIALFCLQSVSEAGAQDAPQIISLSASREYVKQWWVVGPFKRTGSPELLARWATKKNYTPSDLSQLRSETYETKNGTDTWTLLQEEKESILSPNPATGEIEPQTDMAILLHNLYETNARNSSAYALAALDVPTTRSCTLLFGSDDGARIWLNGDLVHSVSKNRPIVPGEDHIPVTFKPGFNLLLIEIGNKDGYWGFALRMMDKDLHDAIPSDAHVDDMTWENRLSGAASLLLLQEIPTSTTQKKRLSHPAAKTPTATQLQFAETTHDFGVRQPNKAVVLEHDFLVKNTGTTPCKIISSGDACMVGSKVNKAVLQPGESSNIHVRADLPVGYTRAEKFSRQVQVKTTDPTLRVLELTMKARFTWSLKYTPLDIQFGTFSQGSEKQAVVWIASATNAPFAITSAEFRKELGTVGVGDICPPQEEAGSVYHYLPVTLRIASTAPVGCFTETLVLHTDRKDIPEIRIPVSGDIK